MPEERVSPVNGGCWFCFTTREARDWVYDVEFDTYLHLSCLKKAVEEEPEDPEVGIMCYLLELHDEEK